MIVQDYVGNQLVSGSGKAFVLCLLDSHQNAESELVEVRVMRVVFLHRVVLRRDEDSRRLSAQLLHHRSREDRRSREVAFHEKLFGTDHFLRLNRV